MKSSLLVIHIESIPVNEDPVQLKHSVPEPAAVIYCTLKISLKSCSGATEETWERVGRPSEYLFGTIVLHPTMT